MYMVELMSESERIETGGPFLPDKLINSSVMIIRWYLFTNVRRPIIERNYPAVR